MFIRFTYLSFSHERKEQSKEMFMREIAPVIRQQKGNKDVSLLEPIVEDEAYISYSLWESEVDIRSFEASEVYKELIAKIGTMVSASPYQKYYKQSR